MDKPAYPKIPEWSSGYMVMTPDRAELLYWGHSWHVARLIANVMHAVTF